MNNFVCGTTNCPKCGGPMPTRLILCDDCSAKMKIQPFCPEQAILPVYINNRDRLSCLQKLIEWLEQLSYVQIVILDNNSTYPPLLDWYSKTKYEVLFLGKNCGHTALFSYNKFSREKQIQDQKPGDWFVYTDPDIIPREDCPFDAIQHFRNIMLKYPEVYKVGFGLEIKEIPNTNPLYQKIHSHEDMFWKEHKDPETFHAGIDTTFALYNKKRNICPRSDLPIPHFGHQINPSLRTAYPYVARHWSWYLDIQNLSEEDRYYIQNAGYESSWSNYIRLMQK